MQPPFSVTVDPEENPPFVWVTIEQADVVLCRMKLELRENGVVVKFLTVDFHWRKKGVARFAVDWLKARHDRIWAPDVRPEALGFWETMSFTRIQGSLDCHWSKEP